MTVICTILELLDFEGISQKEFAAMTGLYESRVSRMINGSEPSLKPSELWAMTQVLNCPVFGYGETCGLFEICEDEIN